MFYLLTSNKAERNNDIYTVGCELIKKVDLILDCQTPEILNSIFLDSDIENEIYNNKVKEPIV
ncbi:hypothetical protein [Paraclostridium bifermentans]|uniref:hypothetical protein n=1 Tax=Paraclostridium bifermentans TaxID=1490 RepID=UPI00115BEF24|nr:hypothetical protein [Paraclostridium bifermentans]TQO57763.1 hypothetical protein D5S05_07400 [Paraclostridium bifermentans]